jgi:hypothetical protein
VVEAQLVQRLLLEVVGQIQLSLVLLLQLVEVVVVMDPLLLLGLLVDQAEVGALMRLHLGLVHREVQVLLDKEILVEQEMEQIHHLMVLEVEVVQVLQVDLLQRKLEV